MMDVRTVCVWLYGVMGALLLISCTDGFDGSSAVVQRCEEVLGLQVGVHSR